MKIDIYIPTYNRKNFLEKAIHSALSQTYSDISIIVSDNMSSDGTEKMMQQLILDNPNIYYHRQEENIGSLRNFQKCIYEYGTGEFSLFLSDDDELIDDTYIEKAIQYIETHKDVVIVTGNTRILYSDLNFSFDTHNILPENITGKEFFLKYGTESYSITWCNAIFRRDLAIQNNCYNGEVFYADSDCFFRLMMFGNVGFIDTIASLYRIHAKNSYKIASLETFLKNENYICRNYEFALETGKFSLGELGDWKDRLLFRYRSTLFDNLILFSERPLRNSYVAIMELRKRGYNLLIKQRIRLFILFIARFFIRFRPIFRFLVSRNYKR